ncbi:MAG: hypothetical protein H0V78_05130 [Burkholderiales bacterium]|nr:hypothetical protein [Burkholderiales bacterium]
MDWERDLAVLETALRHARKAVALAPRLPYAHAALRWVQLWRRNGKEVTEASRRAVALDQNNAEARLFLAFSLASCGHAGEALGQIQFAMCLSPVPSPAFLNVPGICHYGLGNSSRRSRRTSAASRSTRRSCPVCACSSCSTRWSAASTMRGARETLQKIGPARRIFTSTFFHDPELASRYEHDRKMAWKDLEGAQE